MEEIRFTRFDSESNHVAGVVDNGEYSFWAKLFDVSSGYGINGGRVSKLLIKHGENEILYYDRGWDVQPHSDYQEVYENILEFLEKSPKRWED